MRAHNSDRHGRELGDFGQSSHLPSWKRYPPPLLHADHLDIEHQRGIRRNDAAGAPRAIAEFGRYDQRALAAHLHSGHTLVPPGDNLMRPESELERLAAVERAVKFR